MIFHSISHKIQTIQINFLNKVYHETLKLTTSINLKQKNQVKLNCQIPD